MHLISAVRRITGFVFIVSLACVVPFAGGCGKEGADSSAGMPPVGSQTPKVAASGPAVSQPLEFNQLALESPVKRFTNKNGLVFLRFRYADRDGNVYECELPEEMSKGSYTIDEWVRTFNVYRLPKVVAKKKVLKKHGPANLGDFPFISPRPQQPQQQPAAQRQPTLEPMPVPMPAPTPPPAPTPTQPTRTSPGIPPAND